MNQNNYNVNNMGNNGYNNMGQPMQQQPMNNYNNGYNPYMQNQYGMNNNYSNNNNKTIIIVVIIIVAIIAGVLLLVFGGKKSDNKSFEESLKKIEENAAKEKDAIISKIVYNVEGVITEDDDTDILIALTSNNSKFINVSIPVKFYDANNTQVYETTVSYMCVEPGTKVYKIATLYDKSFSEYKIDKEGIKAYDVSGYDKCVNYNNKIDTKFEKTDNDRKVDLIVTNNTGKQIIFGGYVLYYKDNKVINTDWVYISPIDINGKAKETISLPYDYDAKKIVSYDEMKLVFSEVEEK